MLEKAIEFVHTKEEIEVEHEKHAHHILEKAIEEEDHLRDLAMEAHHDAEDAEAIITNYRTGAYGEDFEMRRELTVKEISNRIEDYVQTRLRIAREKEERARKEEETAHETLEQMERYEEELKAALAELEKMKAQQ